MSYLSKEMANFNTSRSWVLGTQVSKRDFIQIFIHSRILKYDTFFLGKVNKNQASQEFFLVRGRQFFRVSAEY